jgi:tetratricopeptide (TPR) repeat protein
MKTAARLLGQRRADEALNLLDQVLANEPRHVDAWLMAAQAEQQRARLGNMLDRTRRALVVGPERADAQLMHVHALMCNGETALGLARLHELCGTHPDDEVLQAGIAEAWSRYGRHTLAQAHFKRAAAKDPSPRHLFNLAASLQASGDFETAEALLERVIAFKPTDYEAYGMRAGLRRQTVASNHVEELEALLASTSLTTQGDIHLCFALAKELEDLGEYSRAFQYLQRGARQRRARLGYRVEKDMDALARIQAIYTREFFARAKQGAAEAGPIFVTGLPRSGTTLVDRILSSHSQVESLGEIDDLAQAITRLADPSAPGSLIDRAAGLDFGRLGVEYVRAARGYGVKRERFIDKSPLNFLYLGLIHVAMPGASVLHLARHPMDACFGMYKTLFRMGYPFSYDLEDLARYYAAYQRLMNYWRTVLPEQAFLPLQYETLVENQEAKTRELLEFCGLPFEAGCLEFHRNASPVATASSVQVRRPMNRDAVQRWRKYENELEPLRVALIREGVAVD